MYITCPSCATRYDVDEERFLPDGRSVRCAECDESWFVPPPQPIERLDPMSSRDGTNDEPTIAPTEVRASRRADPFEETVDAGWRRERPNGDRRDDAPESVARFRFADEDAWAVDRPKADPAGSADVDDEADPLFAPPRRGGVRRHDAADEAAGLAKATGDRADAYDADDLREPRQSERDRAARRGELDDDPGDRQQWSSPQYAPQSAARADRDRFEDRLARDGAGSRSAATHDATSAPTSGSPPNAFERERPFNEPTPRSAETRGGRVAGWARAWSAFARGERADEDQETLQRGMRDDHPDLAVDDDYVDREAPAPSFGRRARDDAPAATRERDEARRDNAQNGRYDGRDAYHDASSEPNADDRGAPPRGAGNRLDEARGRRPAAEDVANRSKGGPGGRPENRHGIRSERRPEAEPDGRPGARSPAAAARYNDPHGDFRAERPSGDEWVRTDGWRSDDVDSRWDRAGWAEDDPDAPRFSARPSRFGKIVDADFEDVGDEYDDGPRQRSRLGPRIREERRRSTALARIEDLDADDIDPIVDRVFNEEFFAALQVQPKELERAIRKARRRAEARDKNRMTPAKALGWSAWAGAVAATLFVAYTYKEAIVEMFPTAANAYNAVGIDAEPQSLAIENVAHRVALSTTGPVIEITGQLRNPADDAAPSPLLQAEALGPDGELLSRWTFAANAARVDAGGVVDFTTRAPAPTGVAEVALSFAPAEGVRVSINDGKSD